MEPANNISVRNKGITLGTVSYDITKALPEAETFFRKGTRREATPRQL
ncbi:MAG: hypothetical protein ABFC98_05465 [Candidatus Cloacimonas sp.]